MAKKKSAEDSADGTETTSEKKKAKKAPAKKATAKKPAAKKPAAKKPRAEKKEEPMAEVLETAPEVADVIEAEILAETPSEVTEEREAIEAAVEAVPELIEEELEEALEEEPVQLSEEEQELSAIYGEDLSAPAMANQEFQDQKTRDEDRPMLPEINAREERKQRWEERRERRKSRREERDRQRDERRAQQQQQQHGRPHEGRPHDGHARHERENRPQQLQQERPPQRQLEMPQMKVNGHDHDGLARVGTPLGDAAAAVFAQLRNGQPLPVRQLAAMMRKRSLVNQDPEQLWPQLKAELLGDERSYRTLGLRPRIVYRGRDLFAPGPVAMSVTADAEAGVATALSKLASATHRAFSQRLQKASPQGFERIIHAYLVAAGYRDIEWVKRVGGISYASALAPGLERTVLISARSGSEAIDRRGIGELRVGVEAKDLVAGILFSASELSEDAERELERAGRSISVVCGDQLVATLIAAGVGVVSSAAPMHYLDDQLLEELLQG
jgi:hypothetical protein